MSQRRDVGEETAFLILFENGHVISQVLCPFIGSFDMTLWLYLSIILDPYAVKMLIRKGKVIA